MSPSRPFRSIERRVASPIPSAHSRVGSRCPVHASLLSFSVVSLPADLRAHFARRGVRWTRQREQVYAALCASSAHPTAEALHSTLRADHADLSLATVYNTLELFTRRGLCRRISSPPAPDARANNGVRYDADLSDHAHVVTADGRVMDLPSDLGRGVLNRLPADLLDEVHKRTGIRVGRIAIEFIEDGH